MLGNLRKNEKKHIYIHTCEYVCEHGRCSVCLPNTLGLARAQIMFGYRIVAVDEEQGTRVAV